MLTIDFPIFLKKVHGTCFEILESQRVGRVPIFFIPRDQSHNRRGIIEKLFDKIFREFLRNSIAKNALVCTCFVDLYTCAHVHICSIISLSCHRETTLICAHVNRCFFNQFVSTCARLCVYPYFQALRVTSVLAQGPRGRAVSRIAVVGWQESCCVVATTRLWPQQRRLNRGG